MNKTGVASNISVMTGFTRDESGNEYFAGDPGKTKRFVDPSSLDPDAVFYNDQVHNTAGNLKSFADYLNSLDMAPFGLVDEDATPAQVLNASIGLASDITFVCYGQAKAYTAAKHGAFKTTYAYVFNRTYSQPGWQQQRCEAPVSSTHPNGNPNKQEYKCHGSDGLIVFGNIKRAGLPDRDGLDIPFAQLIVDYWSSFARTLDPNPNIDYLIARGYKSTLKQVEKTRPWEAVDAKTKGLNLRLLQWDGGQIPFVQEAQCKAVGASLDVLEPLDENKRMDEAVDARGQTESGACVLGAKRALGSYVIIRVVAQVLLISALVLI